MADWLILKKDTLSGIETLNAHFEGHAYDPHWHDSYLVGFTEQGVQQFDCGRKLCTSEAGGSFLINPGEIHNGRAPSEGGFTYKMLYIPIQWMNQSFQELFPEVPEHFEMNFQSVLYRNTHLTAAISGAYLALHNAESNLIREACLDQLLDKLSQHLRWRDVHKDSMKEQYLAEQTRAYLYENLHKNISLQTLAEYLSVDRYRLTRAFKKAYAMAPHAYLIQLRLVRARQLLSLGESVANVASDLGFADQSHLGRWFKRAYRITPAAYSLFSQQKDSN